MQQIGELLTFEQFRLSHDETLRRQRETLENDEIAEAILREGSRGIDWLPWGNDFVTAS